MEIDKNIERNDIKNNAGKKTIIIQIKDKKETRNTEDRQYVVTKKLPQIYTANHETFPIQIREITVQICGIFLVTQ